MAENQTLEQQHEQLQIDYKNLIKEYNKLTEYAEKQKAIIKNLKAENNKKPLKEEDSTLISEYFSIINELVSRLMLNQKIIETKKETESSKKFAYVNYNDFKKSLGEIVDGSNTEISFEEITRAMTSFHILWTNPKTNRVNATFTDRVSRKTIQVVKIRREILGIAKDGLVYEYRKQAL